MTIMTVCITMALPQCVGFVNENTALAYSSMAIKASTSSDISLDQQHSCLEMLLDCNRHVLLLLQAVVLEAVGAGK